MAAIRGIDVDTRGIECQIVDERTGELPEEATVSAPASGQFASVVASNRSPEMECPCPSMITLAMVSVLLLLSPFVWHSTLEAAKFEAATPYFGASHLSSPCARISNALAGGEYFRSDLAVGFPWFKTDTNKLRQMLAVTAMTPAEVRAKLLASNPKAFVDLLAYLSILGRRSATSLDLIRSFFEVAEETTDKRGAHILTLRPKADLADLLTHNARETLRLSPITLTQTVVETSPGIDRLGKPF